MKFTILIVEDEYLISWSIKTILIEEGYNLISEIESVEDAIGVIESQPVHLVLLDINLRKDKDGIDLGHYLLTKATLPFIYLTSNSDKITIDRAAETRPQGYLIKPFRAVDLKTTVAIVLNNFSLRKIDTTRADEATSDTIPFILKKPLITLTKTSIIIFQLRSWLCKPHGRRNIFCGCFRNMLD